MLSVAVLISHVNNSCLREFYLESRDVPQDAWLIRSKCLIEVLQRSTDAYHSIGGEQADQEGVLLLYLTLFSIMIIFRIH